MFLNKNKYFIYLSNSSHKKICVKSMFTMDDRMRLKIFFMLLNKYCKTNKINFLLLSESGGISIAEEQHYFNNCIALFV